MKAIACVRTDRGREANAAWQIKWLPPAAWVQFLVSNNNITKEQNKNENCPKD
jgi:hypothetical protein